MPNVIRLGDPTSHGGKVTAVGASHFTVDGVAVACVGDTCSCPLPGHVAVTIQQGDASFTIDGKPVAFAGHVTSCGAALQSTIGIFAAGQ